MPPVNPFDALAAALDDPTSTPSAAAPDPDQTQPAGPNPRLITYHQTHFHNGTYISPLPLLEKTQTTHVNIAAIHLNATPGDITLNDDPWTSSKIAPLLSDMAALQKGGVRVMGMLGGAAKGTFTRLDADSNSEFEKYYLPLAELIRAWSLDGMDLDVEEDMSLSGVIRLILRLKADFGEKFLISLAPVAAAMAAKTRWWDPQRRNLSGFDYFELEKAVGTHVGWYNCQFYNGWGDFHGTQFYLKIIGAGWDASKIVVGVPTSPEVAGSGFVEDSIVCLYADSMIEVFGNRFGGIMGWEYWNSVTLDMDSEEDRKEYWRWCRNIGNAMEGNAGS